MQKYIYIKNKTGENWEKYRKLRNECVKETRKVKKEYYQNLNISDITDNTFFWKTRLEDNCFLILKNSKSNKAYLHSSCTEWKNKFI